MSGLKLGFQSRTVKTSTLLLCSQPSLMRTSTLQALRSRTRSLPLSWPSSRPHRLEATFSHQGFSTAVPPSLRLADRLKIIRSEKNASVSGPVDPGVKQVRTWNVRRTFSKAKAKAQAGAEAQGPLPSTSTPEGSSGPGLNKADTTPVRHDRGDGIETGKTDLRPRGQTTGTPLAAQTQANDTAVDKGQEPAEGPEVPGSRDEPPHKAVDAPGTVLGQERAHTAQYWLTGTVLLG